MRTSLGNTGEGRYTVYTLDLRVNLHLLKIWWDHILSGCGASHDYTLLDMVHVLGEGEPLLNGQLSGKKVKVK